MARVMPVKMYYLMELETAIHKDELKPTLAEKLKPVEI